MKILTVLGTRPEIIRLSRIIPKLDQACNHILVHTGQNYNTKLSDIFFTDLGLRNPDYYLNAKGSIGNQIAIIAKEIEKIFTKEKPNKVLVLGDTNSGLSAIIAERMSIPVYHMESGNRCYDKEVPEEVNRSIIDHVASYNFPYTPRSRENLIKEGIDRTKIITSGNPIYEVLKYYNKQIDESHILDILHLCKQGYFLVTFHRAECVDNPKKLNRILIGLEMIENEYKLPIIVSVHPRTRSKLNHSLKGVQFLQPFGFFDFVKLEKHAFCMISDSGTCCEEGTILRTPTVICRNTTERPETIETGSAMLSGINSINILECTKTITLSDTNWEMPIGYIDNNVSEKMVKYLIGVL